MTLRQKIEAEIRRLGPIPFSRYMEMCLYDPELGYYSGHAEQFGKTGDFYTSSDIHAVFGRLLARQFEEMWRLLGAPAQIEILELGPGRGLFAQDVLDWSKKKFPEFFAASHYSLFECSPALGRRLREVLDGFIVNRKASLVFPDETENREGTTSVVPERPQLTRALAPEVPIIIFSNEFFDALPVEVLSTEGSLRVDAHNGRFVETWAAPSSEELEFLDRYSIHPQPGDRLDVPLLAQCYASQVAAMIQTGFMLAIDYGYTREQQLAGTHHGTVTTYSRHASGKSPYELPGEQDITTHVNFTALAAAVRAQGLTVFPLRTQAQFLLGIGEANQFADAFEECRLPQERAKVALQLKHLVAPAGMGESFQVLVAGKGVGRTAKLSGLEFTNTLTL
ncbi:MAG TPA: SAM-dependent methyltransferase [Terriglobales bacterium]